MAFNQPLDPGPRRSRFGPQTSSPAEPRRALSDETPILEGYTYRPKLQTPPDTPPGTPPPPPPAPPPRPPLLRTQPTTDSITNYRPKRHLGWIIAVAAVLVLGLVGGLILNSLPQPAPTTSSTPRPTSYTSQTRTGGAAFSDGKVSGYWKITDTQWSATGVQLTLEITVDSGILYYAFFVYDEAGDNTYLPQSIAPTDLDPGFVGPNETVVGTLHFTLPRQPLTLIMQSRSQIQLSGLPVSG